MRVYLFDSSLDYQGLSTVRDEDEEILWELDHKMVSGATWKPIDVEVIREDEEDMHSPRGDFPYLGGTPCLSRKAVEALRNLLLPNGEILPLVCDEGEYYAYNVTTVIDCLDEKKSQVVRFKSDGAIMKIEKHVFLPQKLVDVLVFKIPQNVAAVYLTDKFVSEVLKHDLKGYEFKEVWRSE